MNEEYTRKELKQIIEMLNDIDLLNHSKSRYNQKKLNEAYSRLVDLYGLFKLEGETYDK